MPIQQVEWMTKSVFERTVIINERINQAADKAKRSPQEITIVAVSKSFGPEVIHEAYKAGLRHFGENRVQEAQRKIPWCPPDITWHGIGYLQSNKVSKAVELFTWIHSVDRIHLVEKLEAHCASHGRMLNILVEVKLSPEPTKSGCPPDQVQDLIHAILRCPHLHWKGLMTIPPYAENPEESRPYYRHLATLAVDLKPWLASFGWNEERVELSMGMSHDYPIAIEEGATLIRLGQAIFGPRPAK